jgi:hypothetical protein
MENAMALIRIARALFTSALLLVVAEPAARAQKERFGEVNFPISCSAGAQTQFNRAVAMLHSFFFPETVKAFAALAAQEPSCAMAYWGVAISQRPNPLVAPFAAGMMKNGWQAIEAGRAVAVKTRREKDWIEALAAFFKDYDTVDLRTRTLAYEAAMARLTERYPDDSEAAIFYALALNEAVDLSDKTFAKQFKAAAILQAIGAEQPNHPGIPHYLIHSYDFASICRQGLPAARRYAEIAPTAPHALHMPSHIYSMLGMWDDSVRSNLAAEAAANDYAAKNFPGATDPSVPHLLDFLAYAYLQLAKDADAKQVVDSLANLKTFASVRLTVDTALSAIPARFALDRVRWDEAAELPVRDSQYPAAKSISYFARALGGARSGHAQVARAEIVRLDEIEAQLAAAKDDYWAGQTRIQKAAAAAWVMFVEGRRDEAIVAMRRAADLDDASEKNVAMENKLLPIRELLGELYLASGMNKEALTEFEISLKNMPNRFRTIAGAAAAARIVGSVGVAKHYSQALTNLAASGDGERPEVAEAKTYLSRH